MTTAQSPEKDGVVRRIMTNIAMLFGGKTAAVLIGLIVLGISARALGRESLGILLLLHAYVTLMSGVATFKAWQAVIQYGAQPVERGEIGRFHALLRFTIGLDISAALFAAILSACLYPLVMPYLKFPPEMLVPGLFYCLLTAVNLQATPLGVLRLLDRFDLISLHSLLVPVCRLIGVSIAVAIGAGLNWFIMVWFAANAVSYLAMPVLALRELHKRGQLKGLFSRPPNLSSPEPGLWRFVWISNLDATIDLGDKNMPTLLAGVLLGPGFAAIFKIARDISDVLVKGASLLDRALYPELVKMMLEGKSARAFQLIVRMSLIMLAIGAVLAAALYIFGPGLMTVAFDAEYAATAHVATSLMIAAALFAATAPLYPALYALGEPGRATLARAACVVTILVLFVVLSLSHGENGPGFAMIIGQAVGLILATWLTLSRLHVRREADGQASRNRARNASINSGSEDPDDKSG